MLTIIDKDRFSPSASGLYDRDSGYYRLGGRGNMKCTQTRPLPNCVQVSTSLD